MSGFDGSDVTLFNFKPHKIDLLSTARQKSNARQKNLSQSLQIIDYSL